jgi:cardiolipin synthase
MVVDDRTALIGSMNWEPENFTMTRDYGVMTRDPREVSEVIDCFDADWSRQPFEPGKSSRLIWCPGGREQIAQFIDSAKHSLFIQNERYQDAMIVEHLVRAKLRGVKVHVMTRPSHSLRAEKLVEGVGDLRIMQDVGIGIRKIRRIKLHAKMLLADKSRAIIGSINLTPGSFDSRREVAIRVEDDDILIRLVKVVHHDWKNARRLDLSDEALLSDLEKHPKQGGLSGAASVTTNSVRERLNVEDQI